MRTIVFTRFSMILLALAMSSRPAASSAAPITGDTGPGGVGNTLGTSGLVVWLKNDTGLFQDIAQTTPATNSNDPVARWRDSSGWNRHADQATGSLQPSLQTGGPNAAKVVRFAADGLVTPNFGLVQSGATPVHVFTTLKYASSSGNASIMDGSGINQMRVYVVSDSVFHLNGGGDISGAVTNPLLYHNYAFGFAGASSYIRSDSTSVASGNLGGASPGAVALGRSPGTGEFANIDVPEFFVFSQAITSVQRTVVENYLSSKFNVGPAVVGLDNSLPSGADRYAGDLSGAGNYDLDVFGIGNDGTSSITTSGGQGFGIEATGGTLGTDEWVLAGHNVINNNANTAAEGLDALRWARSWYVDKTGTVDATLAFDFSDAGLGPPMDQQFLLYRSDESSSWTILATPTSISGDLYTFALDDSSLQGGLYTLGVLQVPEPSTLVLLGLCAIGLAFKARCRRRTAA